LKLFNYFWLKFVKVDIENPIALHFIMQDDLFFLQQDREAYANVDGDVVTVAAEEAATEIAIAVKVSEVIEVVPVAEVAKVEFNYKGKKAELLILVHYPEFEFINETHLTALESILKRKGLAVDDIAILNTAKHANADFAGLKQYFNPQKILLLGEKALPTGIAPLKMNTLQQLDKTAILYSFSFDEMMDSPENKKAFWEQMKGF
jgi:hypothetical protein